MTEGVESPETLTDCLFHTDDPKARKKLEKYRKEYEAKYGTTDLTKRYTTQWPEGQRSWLEKNDMKAYFDGMPPFVKAYVKKNVLTHVRDGTLDNMPAPIIALYTSGQMILDHEKGRGR